jgi:hypothetical protein
MTVNRAAAIAVTKDIEAAVAAVLAKHGLSAGRVSTRYGESYKVSIEATAIGAPAPEASDWMRYATGFGLPADALGGTFTSNGRTFRITGLNLRARRMPVLACEVRSGKAYKFAIESVLRALPAVQA